MRGIGIAVSVALLAAALGVLASAGFAVVGAGGPASADQYQPRKVTICHHTQGKGATKHVTIRVSAAAVRAHRRHGDTVGPCGTAKARKTHATKAHIKKFHKRKRR